jgi:hypothetical protein
MTFHIGQKVICVDDRNLCFKLLSEGSVYTVSHVEPRGISIVEVPGGGFFAQRFRPIVERETSIEIFTAMLTPKKQGVDA